MEAATGFEPVNNGFADRRLTTWLCRLWSGKRDLNPRLQPWQGCTLPLSYSRIFNGLKLQDSRSKVNRKENSLCMSLRGRNDRGNPTKSLRGIARPCTPKGLS